MSTELEREAYDSEVIVGGHLCLDILPDMRRVPTLNSLQPGKLLEVGAASLATGGPVSNTGLALHKLGVRVELMSIVGDDLIGQLIVAYLRGIVPTLAASIRPQAGQSSSYTVVIAPGGADRTFLHSTGTNATFGVEHIDFERLKHARLFHFGYPPLLPRVVRHDGAELIELFARAKATGVVTSLEMAVPDPRSETGQANWQRILRGTLPNVDVFVPSIEESLFMLRRADHDAWGNRWAEHVTEPYLWAMAGEVIEMGVAIAGFKLGHLGIYLHTAGADRIEKLTARLPLDTAQWANIMRWHPAFQVEVAGTTGAGDAAYAGLIVALLRSLSPMDAIRWACAVGACCVEAADAVSGIRSRAETEARLAAGWPTRIERLTSSPTAR
ncbi:MAG: carbohydrate kinase family protein [Aggregatilineales bacterium]